jgi:hypothetical protein
MDKLTMAHEFAMQLIKAGATNKTEDVIKFGWEYADAMQAEADSRVNKERPDVLQEEWQPDWSVAPDAATVWTMSSAKNYYWYDDLGHNLGNAPSFSYIGDWQDSLRKRP